MGSSALSTACRFLAGSKAPSGWEGRLQAGGGPIRLGTALSDDGASGKLPARFAPPMLLGTALATGFVCNALD